MGIGLLARAVPPRALWVVTGMKIIVLPQSVRLVLVKRNTGGVWTVSIALLSMPTVATVLWVMKCLAPTRRALAGASASLLAGSLAALAKFVALKRLPRFWPDRMCQGCRSRRRSVRY